MLWEVGNEDADEDESGHVSFCINEAVEATYSDSAKFQMFGSARSRQRFSSQDSFRMPKSILMCSTRSKKFFGAEQDGMCRKQMCSLEATTMLEDQLKCARKQVERFYMNIAKHSGLSVHKRGKKGQEAAGTNRARQRSTEQRRLTSIWSIDHTGPTRADPHNWMRATYEIWHLSSKKLTLDNLTRRRRIFRNLVLAVQKL